MHCLIIWSSGLSSFLVCSAVWVWSAVRCKATAGWNLQNVLVSSCFSGMISFCVLFLWMPNYCFKVGSRKLRLKHGVSLNSVLESEAKNAAALLILLQRALYDLHGFCMQNNFPNLHFGPSSLLLFHYGPSILKSPSKWSLNLSFPFQLSPNFMNHGLFNYLNTFNGSNSCN